MTELTITPKVSDKTARFKGTVAAGEHVAVTIKGGAEWLGEDEGANLTLRVLDLVTGRTLAVFPRPAETLGENETADAWSASDEDADDLYCELNLNTVQMVNAARHMLRVPVLFVLGDTDDPRTLYFRDRYEIEYWPERIGDTAPYDLDKWPKQIDEWSEQVAQFGEALAGHVGDAVAHVTATERATWNSKYTKPVSGIPANDLAEGVRSAIAAVPNKADKATTYTKTEVDSLVSGVASGVFVVADSLPATGEANKIYLVPNGSGAAGNVRDEYMWVNGAWELIGSTQVDLTNYYDKTAADGRFVQKETGKGLVAVDATLSVQGAAADAKATGDALDGKRGMDDLSYGGGTSEDWYVTASTIEGSLRLVKANDYNWTGVYGNVQYALVLDSGRGWLFVVGTGGSASIGGSDDAVNLATTINGVAYALTREVAADSLALESQIPSVPSASTETPVMDGTGSAGSSKSWARGDHVHPSDTSKQDALTSAQLANIEAVPGKADAADLRYRIASASVRKTLPADCFPVTFTNDGVSYSINSLVEESEASAAGDMFIMDNGTDYSLTMVGSPTTGSELMSLIDVATFSAGGVFESSGYLDLQFGGVSPVADTSPTLADIHILADRTVNLITATDETSIDIELPGPVEEPTDVRRARDFFLDVDNSTNASDLALEFTKLGSGDMMGYTFVTDEDDDIAEMMTVESGKRARLYFTETPYGDTSGAAIQVARITLSGLISTTTTQGGN